VLQYVVLGSESTVLCSVLSHAALSMFEVEVKQNKLLQKAQQEVTVQVTEQVPVQVTEQVPVQVTD
jgi:hypothetical protein